MLPLVMRALTALLLTISVACGEAANAKDPLASEIERWTALLSSKPAGDKTWGPVKQAGEPALAQAGEALREGRRLLAAQRLFAVREDIAAAVYLSERSAETRRDLAGFEAEWARMGSALKDSLGAPDPKVLEGVEPAAVRALGEAALPQIRGYYEASLEYGRNTMPGQGLYYLGAAQAERELVDLSRTLSQPSGRRAPPLRSITPELSALESELLAAYRPPASIDKHGQFIGISSTLKEARELDAAGLRFGALLRYLQAALRFAPLRGGTGSTGQLSKVEARLSAPDVDHSLGRLFLEIAQAEPESAAAIADHVLPRYFAALEPAPAQAPKPAPQVTVTLVRWPYT